MTQAAPPASPPRVTWTSSMAGSLVNLAKKLSIYPSSAAGKAPLGELFPKTDPAVDGDECDRDCDSCTVRYPKGFKVEENDALYGLVKGWETHVLVATGKSDWVREVTDEKGSVMEAFGKAAAPSNGNLKLSASNIPTPSGVTDYSEPTRLLLLPAFTVIDNVVPRGVPTLIDQIINNAPTNTTPLTPFALPTTIPIPAEEEEEEGKEGSTIPREMTCAPSPHQVLILLCSQKTRDARCGQSAPLIRKELERHLRPLGLYRDLDDERPGGVGIYFISHVGGHKYSANMMIYRRPDAFGVDAVSRAEVGGDVRPKAQPKVKYPSREKVIQEVEGGKEGEREAEAEGEGEEGDVGAGQCIWLARVRPEDCENIVRYTVLQGKLVKPERQLRGGFDRGKGLLSW